MSVAEGMLGLVAWVGVSQSEETQTTGIRNDYVLRNVTNWSMKRSTTK